MKAMREDVDRARVLQFLEALGASFRHPAKLVLSGGEAMVWRGLRAATRDIDVAYEVDPAHHDEWQRAVVALKERLNVNVEEAQPSDFVPLPPGARDRAEFIGRFGSVDVFLCDPYSVAFAKLDRGSARDLGDVRALLTSGTIAPARLHDLVEAAIASPSPRRLQFDPARVRRNLAAVVSSS